MVDRSAQAAGSSSTMHQSQSRMLFFLITTLPRQVELLPSSGKTQTSTSLTAFLLEMNPQQAVRLPQVGTVASILKEVSL